MILKKNNMNRILLMRKWGLMMLGMLMSLVSWSQIECPPSSCPVGACHCIQDATVTDRDGTLYDDGGPTKDYRMGEEELTQVITYLFTIEPTVAPDTIALQFSMIDIEASDICEYDHIEILDGLVSLGTFCGNELPPVLFATSGSVNIRWLSDPNAGGAGFELRWFSDSIPPEPPVPPVVESEPCTPILDSACNRGIESVKLKEIDSYTGMNCGDWDHRDEIAYFQAAENADLTLLTYGLFDLDNISVFIDWNNDGLDPTDLIYLNSVLIIFVDDNILVPVVVPPTQAPGAYRMRVRKESAGTGDPCEPVGPGEFEDYTLIVEGDLPRCAENGAPNNQMACFNTQFTWDANATGSNATSYLFYLREKGDSLFIIEDVEVSGTSYTHTSNLPSNTEFEWYVLPKNANGTQEGCALAPWSFTTGEPETKVKFVPNQTSVCAGEVLSLDPKPQLGEVNSYDDYNHQWSGTGVGFLDRTDTSGVDFTCNIPGDFILYYTAPDLIGCSSLDSMKINVRPIPVPGSIAGPAAVCTGDSLTMEIIGYQGNVQWQVDDNGVWMDVLDANDSILTVLPTDPGSYRVVVEQTNCIDSSASYSYTINGLPENPEFEMDSHTGAFYICKGVATFISSTNYNSGTDSLLWENDSLSSPNFAVTEPGVVSVVYTDPNGCQSSDSIMVEEFFITKAPVLYPTGDAQICSGDEVNYNVVNYLDSLLWMDGTIGKLNTFNSDLSNIFVTYTDERGCKINSDTVNVVVVADLDEPVIVISPSDEVCVGDSIEFRVTNFTNDLYWNDSAATVGSVLKFKTTQVRDYAYLVRFSTANCESFNSAQATANPVPAQTTIYVEGDSIIRSMDAGFPLYQWFDANGDVVSSTVNAAFVPDSSGFYSCELVNQFGCNSQRSEAVYFDTSIGVQELGMQTLSIFPNPTNGEIFVQKQLMQSLTITIYNSLGQEIEHIQVPRSKRQVSISLGDQGIYFVQVRNAYGVLIQVEKVLVH